jgi:hypothetical protein
MSVVPASAFKRANAFFVNPMFAICEASFPVLNHVYGLTELFPTKLSTRKIALLTG